MDAHELVRDLKKVRERGIAKAKPADVPALKEALSLRWPDLDDPGLAVRLEEFLATAAKLLGSHDEQGIRLALGIGGLGGNSADRREDFAAHYDRTAETVRKPGGLEEQAFTRLAKAILTLVEDGSTSLTTPSQREAAHDPEMHATDSLFDPTAEARHTGAAAGSGFAGPRVVVGTPAGVASAYQRRRFDDEIDTLWADGGDRRIWLRGGPGLGKSYSARRVMQEALAPQGPEREVLLIWVDSADASSIAQALSLAVDRMPRLGIAVPPDQPDRVDRQARSLMEVLATSDWRWLIVLDNADPGSLIEARLIPPGTSPNGRTLITTTSRDHRIIGSGRVVPAEMYTPSEAEAYLRAQLDPRHGGPATLATESSRELRSLARTLGHHPLALSIAAATIVANDMAISDWIAEFDAAGPMDTAADHPDQGGYPHLIGATWRVALGKAAKGLPAGVVERAAAVAAVLDPDGHPTWVWDRKAVAAWVAGEAELAQSHGRPLAVQRLIDHGLIELSGGSWKSGTLTIHRLAARSVRELIPDRDLAELADILLKELGNEDETADAWVTQTDTVLRSVVQLLSIPGLSPRRRSEGLKLALSLHILVWDRVGMLEAAQGSYEAAATIPVGDPDYNEYQLASTLSFVVAAHLANGQADEASAALARYQEIIERLAVGGADEDRTRLADQLGTIGLLQETLGRTDDAAASCARALDLYLSSAGGELSQKQLAHRHRSIGALQARTARHGEAEQSLTLAAQTLRPTSGARPHHAATLAMVLQELAPIQERLGHWHDAQASHAERIEILQELEAAGAVWAGANLPQALRESAASVVSDPERQGEADALLVRAVEVTARLAETAPDTYESQHAQALNDLGMFQMNNGQLSDAVDSFTRAISTFEFLAEMSAGDQGSSRLNRLMLAACLKNLAKAHADDQQFGPAEASLTRAIDLARKLTEEDPGDTAAAMTIAIAMARLSVVQAASDDLVASADSLTRAAATYQLLEDVSAGGLPDGMRNTLAVTIFDLGSTHLDLDHLEQAEDSFSRSAEIARALAEEHPDMHAYVQNLRTALLHLATTQELLGKEDAARDTLTQLNEIFGDSDVEG